MPELPEVETVRRGLAPVFEGVAIARVEQRRPDLRFPFPPRFAARLKGRTVTALGRRAKYLTAALDDGATLVMHLGMSGSFAVGGGSAVALPALSRAGDRKPAHDHVVFSLASGRSVTYNDPRRFGFMLLVPRGELERHPRFRDLGPEPLGPDFDGARLARRFAGRATSLKAALLDQRVVAGLGNIYVCEALWRARLDPERAADAATPAECRRLAIAVRNVLDEAIAAGGSTLRDYRRTDGSAGAFQARFAVYDRDGGACTRRGCDGTIARIVQNGRATFRCAACQA
jgi:formamidopyrimidine-DNA glycosylase